MWLTFAYAVVACVAFLYLPGFLFNKGLGLQTFLSLVCAPLASVTLYCVFGIAYSRLGLHCTWALMFFPVFALCLIAFLIGLGMRARHSKSAYGIGGKEHLDLNASWGMLCLYLVIGIALGVHYFVFSLETPFSIVQEFDNGFHVSVMRAIYESGTWSVLDISKYMTPQDIEIVPLAGGGFYPAAWHITGAFLMSLLGTGAALAENAVNFTLISIVFPSGVMLFLSCIFRKRTPIYIGSLCMLAFIAFPWVLLIWGPLFPNVFAYTLVPIEAALFMRLVNALIGRRALAAEAAVFALGVCAIVFTQPNTIFFCVVLLAPYCVYRMWTLPEKPRIHGHVLSRKLLVFAFLLFVVIMWVVFLNAPFMGNLLTYNWPAKLNVAQALQNLLELGFGWYDFQISVAVVVLLGIACTLVRREYLWLTVAYLFFCIAYLLCTCTEGLPKHAIAGFWYTDPFRLMACMAVIGIPLACLGLSAVLALLKRLLSRHPYLYRVLAAVVLALFCVFTYAKSFTVFGISYHTPLDQFRGAYADHTRHDAWVAYGESECEFVEKVKELIAPDDLVVNIPDDGSAYAYGVNGLRTYYRDYRTYMTDQSESSEDEAWETPESRRIRLDAANISTDPDVREAFENIGARYVLILDQGDAFDEQPKTPYFNASLWTGLSSITDDTPGFEIVLSEDDMRLYRIAP